MITEHFGNTHMIINWVCLIGIPIVTAAYYFMRCRASDKAILGLYELGLKYAKQGDELREMASTYSCGLYLIERQKRFTLNEMEQETLDMIIEPFEEEVGMEMQDYEKQLKGETNDNDTDI